MLAKNTKQVAILLGRAGPPIGGGALERFVGYGGWDQRAQTGPGVTALTRMSRPTY